MFYFDLFRTSNRVLFFCFLFCSANCFSQTPNECGNYYSVGTDTSLGWTQVNPICDSQIEGGVWAGEAIWTGSTCSGFIETTVVGLPVYCLSVIYGSVNLDDYATISTNTGGILTITGVNVGVTGNVIGPYQCSGESGDYGRVSINVCSTIPFSVLTLTNTGCSSGWVINCAPLNCDTTISHAIPDFQICSGSTVQLGATGGVSYQWHANPNLSELSIANPNVTINNSEIYVVDITNLYGCKITDTVKVELKPLNICDTVIDVPEQMVNAFSPNGDGINDFWEIAGIEEYLENEVIIYGRWGDQLILIDDYNNNDIIWDGNTPDGKNVPGGTYYYVVYVNGDQNQAGWVQVVK